MSQPAIFVASLAALESLKISDPAAVERCEGAAGLSLGEYTALTFAGTMDFAAGLEVVRRRGQAMQAASLATPSGMASVLGLDEAKTDELCHRVAPHGRLWKANMLGPGNIAVSGDAAALEALEPIATELGAMRAVRLAVAGRSTADHEAGRRSASRSTGQDPHPRPAIPVYSNVTPRPIRPTRQTLPGRLPPRSLNACAGRNRCGDGRRRL